MARNTNTEPKQFTVVSCNHDNLAATMNQVWESGYSPWKILTAVDADGVRFFTIEGTLDLERYNAGGAAGIRYVAQRCQEKSLADALNRIHAMGYDPTKQWSHKNADGQREFCVLGVLSESRFVDPKQAKLEFDRKVAKDAAEKLFEATAAEYTKPMNPTNRAPQARNRQAKVEPIEAARFRDQQYDTPSRRRKKPEAVTE